MFWNAFPKIRKWFVLRNLNNVNINYVWSLLSSLNGCQFNLSHFLNVPYVNTLLFHTQTQINILSIKINSLSLIEFRHRDHNRNNWKFAVLFFFSPPPHLNRLKWWNTPILGADTSTHTHTVKCTQAHTRWSGSPTYENTWDDSLSKVQLVKCCKYNRHVFVNIHNLIILHILTGMKNVLIYQITIFFINPDH